MKVVIAPDSFKESLSAMEAVAAIAEGWQKVFPGSECVCIPMADGGEGTVQSLIDAMPPAAAGKAWKLPLLWAIKCAPDSVFRATAKPP